MSLHRDENQPWWNTNLKKKKITYLEIEHTQRLRFESQIIINIEE